ncbi:MAG: tyrosine-type recombinase/integrase [Clostridia bacterium]|nr:tyrosine-type recombinase/integrase [Clostridia bacterium]
MKSNGFFEKNLKNAPISSFLEPFLLGKKAEGRSPATIGYYREKLGLWFRWLEGKGIKAAAEITPAVIRSFLLEHKASHNQGGVHAVYRAIKALLNWMWFEYEFSGPNPILKVKCETNRQPPIEGLHPDHIGRIFNAAKNGEMPERDCAILAVLLDTGIRRASLAGIQCRDVDLIEGAIFIRHVKAGKQYTVHLGRTARNYLRKYAQGLPKLSPEELFWRTKSGDACRTTSFYRILCRIEDRAGVPRYSLHDYRRYFALESYRNGADIYEIAQMLGHTGIGVTERYLAVDEKDRAKIHAKVSPLDRAKK